MSLNGNGCIIFFMLKAYALDLISYVFKSVGVCETFLVLELFFKMIFFFILSLFLIPILLSSFKNKIFHIKIFFKDLGKFLKVSLYFCKFQKYEVTCGILLAKKKRSVSTEVCLLLSRKSNFFSFPREMFFFFILS